MPKSVEVPPTSATSASVSPVRKAAPRMELAGPEPMVRMGKRTAYSRPIKVPSFWANSTEASISCSARAVVRALATSRATRSALR